MNSEEYQVTGLAYIARAEDCLSKAGIGTLFYAAFELRCALERTMYEFLLWTCTEENKQRIRKSIEYKPNNLKRLARQYDTDFEKRIRFASQFFGSMGLPVSGDPLDLKWIERTHKNLNAFLHFRRDPNRIELLDFNPAELRLELNEIVARLKGIQMSNVGYLREATPVYKQLWEAFRKDKVSESDLRHEFKRIIEEKTGLVPPRSDRVGVRDAN